MKYRVKVDLAFTLLDDAKPLMEYAKKVSARAVSINKGKPNEEISFCEFGICRHDEGLPCTLLERTEVNR